MQLPAKIESVWLDRLIGWVNPEVGLKRLRARAAMYTLRAYEGAKKGRRTEGWVTAGGSANAEISTGLQKLRERSRDLVRNNPYGEKALNSLAANLIGTGILPQSKAKNKTKIESLWRQWINQCDADGQLDFYGIQALVTRTVKESGECLIRLRQRRPEDGLIVPFQLQVLEPDYLDSLRQGVTDTGYMIQGVEFDQVGRRIAYWLFDQHPGEIALLPKNLVSRRIPADNILHIYTKKRPGQVRGVPEFASVLVKMRDLDEYEEAELVRKKIESCFAAFVVQPEGMTTVGLGNQTTSNGIRTETFAPGMVEYLRPGEDVRFGEPNATGGYADYVRQQLHAVAAGIGITYEQLTGDLSQVNFSSMRAGTLEFRRAAEQFQWMTFVPMFCLPVYKKFIDTCVISGLLKKPEYEVEWTPPKWDWVDPLKDIKATKEAVTGGLMSLSEAIRRQGYDPASVFKELADDNKTLEELKIVVDTNAKHSVKQPAANPSNDSSENQHE